MIIIESLHQSLRLSDEATAQLLAHHQDKRKPRPPFDEWYGPEDVQRAASDALEHLPELLAVVDAARKFVALGYPAHGDEASKAWIELVNAVSPLTAPVPEREV